MAIFKATYLLNLIIENIINIATKYHSTSHWIVTKALPIIKFCNYYKDIKLCNLKGKKKLCCKKSKKKSIKGMVLLYFDKYDIYTHTNSGCDHNTL